MKNEQVALVGLSAFLGWMTVTRLQEASAAKQHLTLPHPELTPELIARLRADDQQIISERNRSAMAWGLGAAACLGLAYYLKR